MQQGFIHVKKRKPVNCVTILFYCVTRRAHHMENFAISFTSNFNQHAKDHFTFYHFYLTFSSY